MARLPHPGRGRKDRPDVPSLALVTPSACLGLMAQRRFPSTDLGCCPLQFPRPAEGSKAWPMAQWHMSRWHLATGGSVPGTSCPPGP